MASMQSIRRSLHTKRTRAQGESPFRPRRGKVLRERVSKMVSILLVRHWLRVLETDQAGKLLERRGVEVAGGGRLGDFE